MKQLDDIIYDAILADELIMQEIGDRNLVRSTCFPVPSNKEDNTPIPNILIIYNGAQNNISSKDCVWEGTEDTVDVSVSVAHATPNLVKSLLRKVRIAVNKHMVSLYNQGETIPELNTLTIDTLMWDELKPCYYQEINYQCETKADNEDEQEEQS